MGGRRKTILHSTASTVFHDGKLYGDGKVMAGVSMLSRTLKRYFNHLP